MKTVKQIALGCMLVLAVASIASAGTINATFGTGTFYGIVHYYQDNAGVAPTTDPTITFTETPGTSALGFVDNSTLAASNLGIGWMATIFSTDLVAAAAEGTVTTGYDSNGLIQRDTTTMALNLSTTQNASNPTFLVAAQGGNYYVAEVDDRVTATSFDITSSGATDSGGATVGWEAVRPNTTNAYYSGYNYGVAGSPDFSVGAADISFGIGSWGASSSATTRADRSITVSAMSLTDNSSVSQTTGLVNGNMASPDITGLGGKDTAPTGWALTRNTDSNAVYLFNTGENGVPAHANDQAIMITNRGTDVNVQTFITQEVGQVVEDVKYTFSVEAASVEGLQLDQDYLIGLYADVTMTTELASLSFNLLDLTTDSWTELSVAYTGTAGTVGDAIYVAISTDHAPTPDYGTTGRGFFTEAVVTTEVVPEPATMSLLVLGGIAMLKRRKK